MLSTHNADVYTDFNGLAKLKTQARKESPEALKEAAKQFEAIFLNNILKAMRQAKLAEGALDNDQSKFYSDMYDQQLAVHLAGKPGVGLADLIVKQLGPDKPDGEKRSIQDEMNHSVGATKTLTGSGQASIRAYSYRDKPLNEMIEIPFEPDALQSDQNLPIHSAEEFIRQLQPYAQQAAAELGVEPGVLLAQAALETGWGRSLIKNGNGSNSFNLFNIKADKSWQGSQARVSTLEFEQGVAKKVNAGFRSYSSYQESFHDYVSFIKNNPRYADALKKAGDAGQYMRGLQQAGYATDPKYADKVMGIYQGDTMDGFKPDRVVAMN
ncbi:MAG: flagellar assembly peptidoglycan hydrolase FlgJ [Methylovulum sp.]|nr:flagellar assembly peptidoglycan hydrolase FlgJ [Methylovulum sp.]